MKARDLALILLQAPVDLDVEIDEKPIFSIAMFAGVLSIDSKEIAMGDAEIVFFDKGEKSDGQEKLTAF